MTSDTLHDCLLVFASKTISKAAVVVIAVSGMSSSFLDNLDDILLGKTMNRRPELTQGQGVHPNQNCIFTSFSGQGLASVRMTL